MLEMIPRRISGNKDGSQKFSRMIVYSQQEGLLVLRRPPLVYRGIVLPEFVETGAFPTATGFGARF